MFVEIERGLLLRALAQVYGVVQKRNTMPVLGHVLLEAQDACLRLRTTDLDSDVVIEIAADVKTNGSTSVAAHLMHDIVRKLPEGEQINLALSEDNNTLLLTTPYSSFNFLAIHAEDFPHYPEGMHDGKAFEFSLESESLRRMIEKTRFAILDDSTRYYLNGIYLHPDADLLYAVATDGHRLSACHTSLPLGAKDMPGVIIPKKCVDEIWKLTDGLQQSIHIKLTENIIQFTFNNVQFLSKLVNGTFPNYKAIIPQDNALLAHIPVVQFAQVVDRIGTISAEKTRAVKLHFSDQKLLVSASNTQGNTGIYGTGASQAQETMTIDYQGDTIDIGFNAKYLLDIADAIAVEDMLFYMKDANSPALIKSKHADDIFYVIMPMRV